MKTLTADHRWSVFSRCVAATLGGYALVSLTHVAMVALLPVAQHKAMLFSSQTGYLTWTGVIIWCFAARTARRAWAGLAIVALPLLAVAGWFLVQRSAA